MRLKKAVLARPAPTDLQKAFEAKCRKDYNITVITRLVGKTFWIYAPTDKPLFDIIPQDRTSIPRKYVLIFVDGSFENKSFYFEYDVVTATKETIPDGIGSRPTDYFNKLYLNLFTAATEILLDPQIPVSFVVMTITDIKKGIEARYTFYLEDFRMNQVGALPEDEFSKRVLQKSSGSTNYIGDELGQHLEYVDVSMPDFLTKQIINRITIKFNQSDFPPKENYEKAILDIIADTPRYYHFTDFKNVHTSDLRTKKKMIITPQELAYFGEDKPGSNQDSNGKLIHITFENGTTTVKDDDSNATSQ